MKPQNSFLTRKIIIGIDATNLRSGGGVTHLVELLSAMQLERLGIVKIVIWGGSQTLSAITDHPWLEKRQPTELNRGLLRRTWWQHYQLSKEAVSAKCDLLFIPGGSYIGRFRPVVTMSQNLLPFELKESLRYGWSMMTLKLLLLRWIQSRSFHHTNGVIFLTRTAKASVLRVTGPLETKCPIIPHGLNSRFRFAPKKQRLIESYSAECPYRVIYVSIIDQYKHQWHVVEAVSILRRKNWPLTLDLVGPAYPPALRRLDAAISHFDPEREWVRYHGTVDYSELHDLYAQADLGLFASSCENMPNILLETMAAGLPVACSNRGPMPEVLRDTGVYFDPEQPDDIARALREFILSPTLRTEKAEASYSAALAFDWQRCADDTFGFLARIAADYRRQVA